MPSHTTTATMMTLGLALLGVAGAAVLKSSASGLSKREGINCTSICAFLQDTTGGVFGRDVKVVYQDLVDHGCEACGSVPTGLPAGINDVSQGMLTVNYVSDPDCFGVCSTSTSKKRDTSLFKREGINCEGSSQCGIATEWVVSDINGWMGNVDDDRLYNNGEHIVCVGGITFCSFLQDTTGGVLGRDLKVLMSMLVDHGCTVCGSVPTGLPAGINDVSQGMLTINYVEDSGGCSGVC